MNSIFDYASLSIKKTAIAAVLVYKLYCKMCICRRNHSSASDFAYSYLFLRSVVCLSSVCHIRAPCLNRWTDLDAIWQVHLWVQGRTLGTSPPRGMGDFGSNTTANRCCPLANRKGAILPDTKSLWLLVTTGRNKTFVACIHSWRRDHTCRLER